jgi:signal transduction histidine kinase
MRWVAVLKRFISSQSSVALSLYIASEIARAHGGTLSVDSSPEEPRFTSRMRFRSLPSRTCGNRSIATRSA